MRLELADERARRERLSFWTLLQVPRERLVLCYPKLQKRKLLQSLLWSHENELSTTSPTPQSLPAAGWHGGRRRLEPCQDELGGKHQREGPPRSTTTTVLGVSVGLEERRFSVSELGDLARCGFRWWSRTVLGLRDTPPLIGSLYHRTLEDGRT